MRTTIFPYFCWSLCHLFPVRAYSDAYLHARVLNPPSHHGVTSGEVVEAHLLFPIDCRFRQFGDMFVRTDYLIYNNIPEGIGEALVPEGERLHADAGDLSRDRGVCGRRVPGRERLAEGGQGLVPEQADQRPGGGQERGRDGAGPPNRSLRLDPGPGLRGEAVEVAETVHAMTGSGCWTATSSGGSNGTSSCRLPDLESANGALEALCPWRDGSYGMRGP